MKLPETVNFVRQNHALEPTLEMMRDKLFDAGKMVTHRYPFDQTKAAFDLVQVEPGRQRSQLDDLAEADDLFTKLMGDVVEPRREFIQQNALSVENLDF